MPEDVDIRLGIVATTIAVAIILAIGILFATGLPSGHCDFVLSKPGAGKMHYIPECH